MNVLLAARAFDPYPFILLNLVLSCVAAIQAPLIMMSQNRQEEKDCRRAENDYKVNLKTEIMIEDLYDKVNAILAKQSALERQARGRLQRRAENSRIIITTRQTGGLHKGYKPIIPTRVSRRGLSLCSSLRVFATLATPKGVS